MPTPTHPIRIGLATFYQGSARSQTEWEEAVKQLLDEGQAFLAYDLAQMGLRQFPDSLKLKQTAARAWIRPALGETERLGTLPMAPDEEAIGILGRVYRTVETLWKS